MENKLKYGRSKLTVNIPDKNFQGKIMPEEAEALSNPEAEVNKSLDAPIESAKLEELVSPEDNVVILVSDISRPAPSTVMLPPIINRLNSSGVSDDKIKIIFGLGVHRRQTPEEKKKLVGDEIYSRIKCIDHDRYQCEQIGITSRGTEAEVFKEVLDADFIVATGNLEYHYFAGFSGGAKALAPGVCSKNTIMQNHKQFMDPLARSGQIEGNPVREDIEEIANMVGVDFLVNAVLNRQKETIKIVSGDIEAAHRQGKKYIEEIYEKSIDEKADIVITSPGGFPKDIDLYQTHKSMEHAARAVKEGGKMIVVGECGDGLGEENFAEALTGDKSPQELIEELENEFILGRHKASRVADIHQSSEIILVSSLPKSITEKLFFRCCSDVNSALEEALADIGRDAKVLVIPFGISTLPRMK